MRAAWARRRKEEQRVGELDAEQDEAVDGLAGALAGDGEPRLAPFKSLGFEAPGAIKSQAQEAKGKTIGKLVAAVRKRKTNKDVLGAPIVNPSALTLTWR